MAPTTAAIVRTVIGLTAPAGARTSGARYQRDRTGVKSRRVRRTRRSTRRGEGIAPNGAMNSAGRLVAAQGDRAEEAVAANAGAAEERLEQATVTQREPDHRRLALDVVVRDVLHAELP